MTCSIIDDKIMAVIGFKIPLNFPCSAFVAVGDVGDVVAVVAVGDVVAVILYCVHRGSPGRTLENE